MTKRRLAIVAVLAAALLQLPLSLPAHATRLPEDMAKTAATTLGGKVRLDGGIEAPDGRLWLLLLPQGVGPAAASKKPAKVEMEAMYPASGGKKPDVVTYSNGWAHIRVLRRGEASTLAMSHDVPEKVRKRLLAMHFPSDLIVPEGFVIAKSLRSLIAEVPSVSLVDDEVLISPDFGMRHVKTAATSHYKGNGSVFLTSITTGSITMLDGKTLRKLAEFPTEGTPCSMELVNGHLYITDEAKNRVLLLDPAKRKFAGQIDLPDKAAPKGIAAEPGGKWLYVSESAAGAVAIIDTSTNKLLMTVKVHPGPGRLAVTPDGNYVLVLNVTSGEVTFISATTQKVVGTVRVGDMPISLAISPDSKTAYIANRISNSVSLVNIPGRKLVGTIKCGQAPTAVAVTTDGARLYVSSGRENTIAEYDCSTLSKLRELHLPTDMEFPGALCMLPDGHHFIVLSQGAETMSIVDLQSLSHQDPVALGHANHEAVWEPVP